LQSNYIFSKQASKSTVFSGFCTKAGEGGCINPMFSVAAVNIAIIKGLKTFSEEILRNKEKMGTNRE
jgi:hypothetical protein